MKLSFSRYAKSSCLTFMMMSLVAVTTATAGRVDRRQGRQGARINQGVRSGELTRKEAAGLKSQQQHVNRMERRAESDGVVTNREQKRLENVQDRASKNIYRQKHDAQEQKSQ